MPLYLIILAIIIGVFKFKMALGLMLVYFSVKHLHKIYKIKKAV